jgi:ABC-type phosphate/phosphonate transport system permease subunit
MANVVCIFVVPIPSLLHQNNIGITYAWTSNFIMEVVRSMPLYFVAMP